MKTTVKELSGNKTQLTITVSAAQVDDVRKAAAYVLAMQNGVMVDPEGKEDLTEQVVEKVGEAQYAAFVDQYLMAYLAPFAITEKNLSIIMNPELRASGSVEAGKDFTFTAVVTIKPQYELESYDPVQVKIPKAVVTDAEIDQQMYALAMNSTTTEEDPDAVVKGGDEVVFGISTVDEKGEGFAPMTAEKRHYKLGDGFLPEEFDNNLLDMKAGDEKTFDVQLPGMVMPDGSDGPERKVTTTVKLQSVLKRVVPAITDSWVKANIPGADDVPALREMIRAQGEEYKAKETENMKFFAVASELATRFVGSIPDEIYEYARGELMASFNAQLKQQGVTLEEWLKRNGMEQQQFSMQTMLEVRETLRQGFALDALARHLKLSLNDEDIEETYKRMAPGQEEQARREFESTGRMYLVREAAMRTKANKWLYDTATFEYVDPGEMM